MIGFAAQQTTCVGGGSRYTLWLVWRLFRVIARVTTESECVGAQSDRLNEWVGRDRETSFEFGRFAVQMTEEDGCDG